MSVEAWFSNGESVVLDDCSTIGCVKVRIAVLRELFAGHVAVVSEEGEPITDAYAKAPSKVVVVLKEAGDEELDAVALRQSLILHAENDDATTCARVYATMKSCKEENWRRLYSDLGWMLQTTTSQESVCKILPTLIHLGIPLEGAMSGMAGKGWGDVVEMLLSARADCSGNIGRLALSEASGRGHVDIVRMLVQARAAAQGYESFEVTPLSRAAQQGHVTVVEVLLNAAASVNQSSDSQGPPVALAAERGHRDVVLFLCKASADLGECSPRGSSPLALACKNGESGVVKTLIGFSARVDQANSEGFTPLIFAAKAGCSESVDALLKRNPRLDRLVEGGRWHDFCALAVASSEGHSTVVKTLLEAKASARWVRQCSMPLSLAAEAGHADVVEMLLSSSADVGGRGEVLEALDEALRAGHEEIVEFLLAISTSFDEQEDGTHDCDDSRGDKGRGKDNSRDNSDDDFDEDVNIDDF